ncbi:hypothetical protein [Curtobacterium aurantiacum]|uniref:Uncharacterized protein n=1 Tax=Curtobacterium aurantiacum TaxID=3236919 RepID=A0ABS5VFD2_9MICO|nr:hypothetical protein [Curtobacterium flaccumfaciens]MBT1546025.1 hypothetical protein [Curtobacterium flaccumfaciens pv. flaccumfaciens]MBT1588183.1 hypothetical protein [Curtobacterium flaccumfaciens pv. flaccumfaciens]MBT1679759.1 hypothetical protein [Curtobacterium flaccumfaciens pv. flaccumfaciens]
MSAELIVTGAVLSSPALALWFGTGWIPTAVIVLLGVPLIVGGIALRIGTPDRRPTGPATGHSRRAPVDEMVGESR